MSAEQKEHWADLVESKFCRDQEKRKISLVRVKARLEADKNAVSVEEFKTISEWQHCAYLELIGMDNKYADLKLAAQALKVPLKVMRDSVERLVDLKLLRATANGSYEVSARANFGSQAPSEGIRFFHQQVLEKAMVALETQGMDRRYNSSAFVTLAKSKIPVIIEELQSMVFKILEPHIQSANGEKEEELYCLSLQFFDLLKKSEEKK